MMVVLIIRLPAFAKASDQAVFSRQSSMNELDPTLPQRNLIK